MPLFENEQTSFCTPMILHSLNVSEDKIETNIGAKFIIHDFEESANKQIITEDICAENMNTLIGQPVLVKYYNEGEKDKDHLGTHEAYITKNRDTGKDIMATDTFAIGTFNDVAIEDIEDFNGNQKRCLVGYATLWLERYYNVCSLLNEWLGKGLNIYCSCEYTFKNYEMKDCIQYIKSPYSYTGHTILNSEYKDGYNVVLPAYDVARMVSWNEALTKDSKNTKENEVNELENIFLTAFNEISIGGLRTGIFEALSKVMVADEYNRMWIGDYNIYESYFIYEFYDQEAQEFVTYKVPYTKCEDDTVSVDYENRKRIEYKLDVVEVEEKNNELETKVASLNQEIFTKNAEIEEIKGQLVSEKETIASLNAELASKEEMITSLNEYKAAYEAEKYKQKLEEAKAVYCSKFTKLNGESAFESENVQELIEETLSIDKEVSLNARMKLVDIMTDLAEKFDVTKGNTRGSVIEPSVSLNGIHIEKKVIKDTDYYTM